MSDPTATADALAALAATTGLSTSREALALLDELAAQQRDGAVLPLKVATSAMKIAASPGLALEDQLAVYTAMEGLYGTGSQYGTIAADRASALRARRYAAGRRDELAAFGAGLAAESSRSTLVALARRRRDAGDAEQHLLVLRRVLELDRDCDALVELAAALRRGGDLKESGALLEEALSGESSDDERRRALTAQMAWQRAMGSAGHLRKAERTGRDLHRSSPDDVLVLRAYGAVEIDLGHLAEAETLLNRAAELAPAGKADRRELRRLSARYRDAGDYKAADRVADALS